MHLLDIAIILLILVGLTVHTYLDNFYDQGRLPYSRSFSVFVNVFALIYFVSFIWMFGVAIGLVIGLLCYFQIIYSAGLWVFLIPYLVRIKHAPEKNNVNLLVYWCHSKLILLLGILTVINFFITPYGSVSMLFNDNYWAPAVVFAAVLIGGNIMRKIIMPIFVKS
jgi:hypothetical protein